MILLSAFLLICMHLRPSSSVSASVVMSSTSSSEDRVYGDPCTMKAERECSSYEGPNELRACVDAVLDMCVSSGSKVLTSSSTTSGNSADVTSTTAETRNIEAVDPSMFLLNRVIGECSGYRQVQVERMQRVCFDGRCTWFKYYVPQMKCIPV